MSMPLVTISIPTFNSAQFLESCLKAIKNQTYPNIEVNIVDGGSSDETLSIAKSFGFEQVIRCSDALLEARYQGIVKAKGDYILLLDSDQILAKDAIENAVELSQKEKKDAIILEEGVYRPSSFIEKLFVEDRKLIHKVKDYSPFTGVLLPRFYTSTILKKAVNSIKPSIRKAVGGQDHAIIYYEVWQLTQQVGLVAHAVYHIEPNSIMKIWKKFYRWGITSVDARFGMYDELLQKKERFRTGLFQSGMVKSSIASIVLLLLKGVPYKTGYLVGKLRKNA